MNEVDPAGIGGRRVGTASDAAADGAVRTAVEMDVLLDTRVPEAAEDEVRSLLRWLREDETLSGRAGARVRDSAPPPGSMGTVFDVVQLTIGSGLSAGALLVSVLQWRDARRRPPGITLRRGGSTIEIPAGGEVDAAVLTRALEFLMELPAPDGSPPAGGEAPAAAPAHVESAHIESVESAHARVVRAGEAAGDGTPS